MSASIYASVTDGLSIAAVAVWACLLAVHYVRDHAAASRLAAFLRGRPAPPLPAHHLWWSGRPAGIRRLASVLAGWLTGWLVLGWLTQPAGRLAIAFFVLLAGCAAAGRLSCPGRPAGSSPGDSHAQG